MCGPTPTPKFCLVARAQTVRTLAHPAPLPTTVSTSEMMIMFGRLAVVVLVVCGADAKKRKPTDVDKLELADVLAGQYDRDGDGVISLAEIAAVRAGVGPAVGGSNPRGRRRRSSRTRRTSRPASTSSSSGTSTMTRTGPRRRRRRAASSGRSWTARPRRTRPPPRPTPTDRPRRRAPAAGSSTGTTSRAATSSEAVGRALESVDIRLPGGVCTDTLADLQGMGCLGGGGRGDYSASGRDPPGGGRGRDDARARA